MYNNKKINHFYKLRDIKLEDGKVFNKKYGLKYDERKNISKNHFLLSNAFDLTRLIKKTVINNKEIIPESYYLKEDKSRYNLNIYNYKKVYKSMINQQKVITKDDELLKALLIKIDVKNVEDIMKDKERKINIQKRALKGVSKIIEPLAPLTYNNTTMKTFNKTNSLKTSSNFNNQSNFKSKDSININTSSKILYKKNNCSLSMDTKNNYIDNHKKNVTSPKYYYIHTIGKKVRGLFNAITTKEKMAENNSNRLYLDMSENNYNSNYYKTFRDKKINLKANSISSEKEKKSVSFIKNVGKIKHKKDLEKILFTPNQFLFSGLKSQLHTLYKEGKKIPLEYLEK